MEIFKLINICQYLYFCKKFAETDKGKRKSKRHLEFTSYTDNKSCKNISFFLLNFKIKLKFTNKRKIKIKKNKNLPPNFPVPQVNEKQLPPTPSCSLLHSLPTPSS